MTENLTRKGIILAGGTGSRLGSLTQGVSKQLMPVFDKPMIYYPLALLIEAGVNDIAIIVRPDQRALFEQLLGTGAQFGVRLTFIEQAAPAGIAQAPILANAFLGDSPFVLALGDNLIDGPDVARQVSHALSRADGAQIFTMRHEDPTQFGVAKFNGAGVVTDLWEKPDVPQSDDVVLGLYVFDHHARLWADWLEPSERGELEIIDLLDVYRAAGKLTASRLNQDTVWLDTGTQYDLWAAGCHVEHVQRTTGRIIGSPELAAFQTDQICRDRFTRLGVALQKCDYGQALLGQLRPHLEHSKHIAPLRAV